MYGTAIYFLLVSLIIKLYLDIGITVRPLEEEVFWLQVAVANIVLVMAVLNTAEYTGHDNL